MCLQTRSWLCVPLKNPVPRTPIPARAYIMDRFLDCDFKMLSLPLETRWKKNTTKTMTIVVKIQDSGEDMKAAAGSWLRVGLLVSDARQPPGLSILTGGGKPLEEPLI